MGELVYHVAFGLDVLVGDCGLCCGDEVEAWVAALELEYVWSSFVQVGRRGGDKLWGMGVGWGLGVGRVGGQGMGGARGDGGAAGGG